MDLRRGEEYPRLDPYAEIGTGQGMIEGGPIPAAVVVRSGGKALLAQTETCIRRGAKKADPTFDRSQRAAVAVAGTKDYRLVSRARWCRSANQPIGHRRAN